MDKAIIAIAPDDKEDDMPEGVEVPKPEGFDFQKPEEEKRGRHVHVQAQDGDRKGS